MYILIAEDDRNACEMYRISLKSHGHEVRIAGNGRECLEMYKESLQKVSDDKTHPFNVVILDYMLPDLDGSKVAEAILKSRPTQRIIIVSAHVNAISTEKIDDMQGFIDIIAKPFGPTDLVEMVESPLLQKRPQKMSTLVALLEIERRLISEDGILKGLDQFCEVLGPKLTPFIMSEFRKRGLVTGVQRKYSGKELLTVLEGLFGASNKAFCVRFFIDFFD
jgi:DNA-binding response OmpR family regulator